MDLAGHTCIETTINSILTAQMICWKIAIKSREVQTYKNKGSESGSTPAVASVSSMIGHNSRRKLKK